jgi:murein endopeptidase
MTRAQRDAYEQPTLVRPDRRGVEMSRWNQGVITLLRLAASLPDVDRAWRKRTHHVHHPSGPRTGQGRIKRAR